MHEQEEFIRKQAAMRIKMVEEDDSNLQLAMGANQGVTKAAKCDEQPTSGVQIVAAAHEEEASEDKAGKAVPEHEKDTTVVKAPAEEETVRRGSSTVSAGSGEAVASEAQSGPKEDSSRVVTYTEGRLANS